jgi:hypothetical protein
MEGPRAELPLVIQIKEEAAQDKDKVVLPVLRRTSGRSKGHFSP